MKLKKRHFLNLVPVLMAFGLIYCNGPGAPVSNLPIDGIQAEETVKLRLKKTQEVRKRLRTFLRSLTNLETTIKTAAYEISLRSNLKDAQRERLSRFVTHLKDHLKQLSEEMVRTRPDGSWTLARKVVIPYARTTESFRNSELALSGGRPGMKEDEMILSLTDLATGDQITLGSFRTAEDGNAELTFNPGELEQLIHRDFRIDVCALSVGDRDAVLACDPFTVEADNFRMEMSETFVRLHSGEVVDLLLSGEIRDRAGVETSFIVQARSGEPLRIDVVVR